MARRNGADSLGWLTGHGDVPVTVRHEQSANVAFMTGGALERWLPIDGEPVIEDAVNGIRAILAASARTDPARTTDATTEP